MEKKCLLSKRGVYGKIPPKKNLYEIELDVKAEQCHLT